MKQIPEYILKNLRQAKNLDENDSSKDSQFYEMSLEDLVELYFTWEGIIGFGHLITEVVTDLQNYKKGT